MRGQGLGADTRTARQVTVNHEHEGHQHVLCDTHPGHELSDTHPGHELSNTHPGHELCDTHPGHVLSTSTDASWTHCLKTLHGHYCRMVALIVSRQAVWTHNEYNNATSMEEYINHKVFRF